MAASGGCCCKGCHHGAMLAKRDPKGYILFSFVDGSKISPTSVTKLLGILIDNNLNLTNHVESVCKQLSSGIFILKPHSSILDRSLY